ncbi:MAG TPA: DNA internalization-related competence protein ComEC/Rec2, partial [Pyrinomonadaceae bacterium]|nr:DNA internalization-related competence protein ComEC/Rec2 [Pyrinomonadaceae bacterium]
AAGICAAGHLSTRSAVVASAWCAVTVVVCLLRARLGLAGGALLFAFFFAGQTLAVLEKRAVSSFVTDELIGRPLLVTGVLDGPPEFARDRVYLSLRVERINNNSEMNVSGRVWLLVPLRTATNEAQLSALQLRYGTRISLTTSLDYFGNYRNPGVSTLAEYLDRREYDATGIVRSPGSIARLEDTNVFKPLAWLYDWRQRLQLAIDSRFAPDTAGVLDAALLGNRYNLSSAVSDRFREGGTFHVLVISGLHITFLGGIVFLVVRRLTRHRVLQFALPATVVWSYSLAVGAEASVVRAALMFTFAGLAAIVLRQPNALNALGAAALVLLVRSPKEIFDPSFQLTFLSVLAIVVIAWPLLLNLSAIGAWYPARATPYPPACSRVVKSFCEFLFWSERKWKAELTRSPHKYRLFKATSALWLERCYLQHCLRYMFGAILVSASVQIVLLPLMIVYFHRLSVASLLLNIVVSILLAALVAVALLALLISQLSAALAAPLLKLADAINWLMVHSVDPFSDLGLAALRLPEYSGQAFAVYLIYFIPLLLLVISLSRWRPLTARAERRTMVLPLSVVQLLLLVVLLLHPFSAGRADGKLRIDFLDVGQGDAALVTMPDGTTLLIDGGGRPSFLGKAASSRRIGETVVSEYLWWRGLSEIDYVVATHADADHMDGLNDVLRNFRIRSVLVARSPTDDSEFKKLSETARETRTPLETIQAGDTIRFKSAEIRVLWPPSSEVRSDNNSSIVLRIQFGERSILFTGDIEKAAEGSLVASQQQPLRTDVVKVPHHGSRTSSTNPFVLATKPTFAIISVGRNSMFGHPHKEVVERWQANGATVLTTGHSGTITVITDGRGLFITSFLTTDEHR